MRIHILVLAIVAVGCTDKADPMGVDGSTGGQCECPNLTALDISYDPSTSSLTASTVQDAIDEVSASVDSFPQPGALVQQLEADDTRLSTHVGEVIVNVACPDGTVALGGACDHDGQSGARVRSTNFNTPGYSCVFDKTGDWEMTFRAEVTCMAAPAE